jgi:lysophospholipase L1-like esterase
MAGPFDIIKNKLAAGQNVTIAVTGDSVAQGYGYFANSGPYGFAGPGWPSRFCADIAAACNANPSLVTLSKQAIGGTQISSDFGWLKTIPANTDALILCDGINDFYTGSKSAAAFAADVQTYINMARTGLSNGTSWGPALPLTVPIIMLTESDNLTTASFSGVTKILTGQTLPLNPPLAPFLNYPNCWYLDTLGGVFAGHPELGYDGIHPNTAGYIAMAAWMASELLSGGTVNGSSSTIAATTSKPTVVRQTPALPANWQIGNTFAASNENAVGATINTLNAAIAQLGAAQLPSVPTNLDAGVTFTADKANTVGTAINALSTTISNLGGNGLSIPLRANWTSGSVFTSDDQNTVESAINALSVSIAILQSK